MSEELIVRHCSPTLAGLKTGCIFSCAYADEHTMKENLRRLNNLLVKKGLRVLPLRRKGGRSLIYVYRPAHLERDLRQDGARCLLEKRGYPCDCPALCIPKLMKRLAEEPDFPHEIGLFLGYPPEDVCGFIENREEDCKCVGCWKVYGDECAAKELFAKYKKCTSVYCEKWAAGRPIEQLAVAG